MNRRVEQLGREAAQEQAIEWLLRLGAPEATEADWLDLQLWLSASPEHRDAFDRAELVCAELTGAAADLLPALRTLPTTAAARRRDDGRRAPLRARTNIGMRVWQISGGLAAAAAAVLFFALRPVPAPTEVFQTAKGETRTVNLADGSHIVLNSGSRLSVRLERKGRYVELAEGEAAFDVAKDPARPFLIAAGERDIRVVGTEFDVLRHEGRLRVTVRRGIVAVQSPEGPSAPVLLKVGDQFERKTGDRTSFVRHVDPDAAFAWRAGELVYLDEPLDGVVADLNRYFTTPVRVVGPAADLRFSGVLKIDKEEDVVRRLQGFLQVAVDRRPDGFTLRSRQTAR
ncbi:MAG TPA: FecR domain-containing protein [Caulobacteraceae bacterium]|jgi:transmembrane sensor|nr:FecR domain-containing protein [Caulobacteraceae bacterium]